MTINGATGLLGLMGWPVSHSFSPAMHNGAAAALGLNLVYLPLPVRPEHLPQALAGLAALGFVGVNVTVPHKQAVLPLLDEVDEAARLIGAVNTIKVGEGGQLRGYNSDWQGFLADLAHQGVDPSGRSCLILGAGGAARAVAYGLGRSAAGRISVKARRPAQAEQLVADLQRLFPAGAFHTYSPDDLAHLSADLIINCTPLGMSPVIDCSPWPAAIPIPAGAFVYDLVYNPRQTNFMAQAVAAGNRAVNGLGMLVEQALVAFEIWTSQKGDRSAMLAALQPPRPEQQG